MYINRLMGFFVKYLSKIQLNECKILKLWHWILSLSLKYLFFFGVGTLMSTPKQYFFPKQY